MPLLCALGILDPADDGYARAARRRFADPSKLRDRAMTLITELDHETRAALDVHRRNATPRLWPFTRPH